MQAYSQFVWNAKSASSVTSDQEESATPSLPPYKSQQATLAKTKNAHILANELQLYREW